MVLNDRQSAYSKSVPLNVIVVVYVLIFALIFLVSCHESEGEREEVEKSPYTEEDIRHDERIKSYLLETYLCTINQVSVTANSVKISGKYVGEGIFHLYEIPPYVDISETKDTSYRIELENSSFVIELDRFVKRDGIRYDRILSKWAIFKEEDGVDRLVSHARYVDEIPALQYLEPIKLTNKKGIGGIIPNQYITDFSLLNISSATINICITHFMFLNPRTGTIAHEYGGRTYYMDENYLKNTLDKVLLEATKKHNISVAAIILIDPASRSADPALGALLEHPDYDGGVYTMPNMTNLESVNCYAAALDFLAKRYSTTNNRYGRISHWIMHNEVDGARQWTDMGVKPVTVFTDTYVKSMRMCYNIVRQYNMYAEVFASFSHSWTDMANPGWYTSKEIIDLINAYSKVEGDYQWAMAYHSYPQDLTNPCTWIDSMTYDMETKFITFKNLEVLNRWALAKDNKYKGTIKRSVWLSEAGVNSRSYSEKDLQDQAVGFAYAWKKINALEGIDGIQWHNWFDNKGDGACLGLRKYLDESYKGEAKPVWEVYRKAGTNEEDEYFEQFLPLIGIPDWNIIENF